MCGFVVGAVARGAAVLRVLALLARTRLPRCSWSVWSSGLWSVCSLAVCISAVAAALVILAFTAMMTVTFAHFCVESVDPPLILGARAVSESQTSASKASTLTKKERNFIDTYNTLTITGKELGN